MKLKEFFHRNKPLFYFLIVVNSLFIMFKVSFPITKKPETLTLNFPNNQTLEMTEEEVYRDLILYANVANIDRVSIASTTLQGLSLIIQKQNEILAKQDEILKIIKTEEIKNTQILPENI